MKNWNYGMESCRCQRFWLSVILAAIALVWAGRGDLQAAQPYYKGKTVILMNNFPPGGSSDVWTRLQARHISRFLPGQPKVVVQNMVGANGLLGYQWLTKSAKPDGLSIGALGGGLSKAEAVGEFPPGTLSLRDAAIVAVLGDTDVFIGRKAQFPQGYKSLLSPAKRPFVLANLKRDDGYARDTAVMNLLGLKKGQAADYIQVYGYPGGNDVYLAMGRGEADMYGTRVSGYRQTPLREVKAGNWVPLYQGGFYADSGEFVRDPGAQDIPTVMEVITELTGKYPSGPYYEYLKWRTIGQTATRLIVVPPRTSQELLAILSEAWRQMLKDPQYRADQEKIFGSKEDVMTVGPAARKKINIVLEKPAIVDKVYNELVQ